MGSRLRADVGWLWLGYVGRTGAYFALTVVLGRALGPERFGELALFLALTLGVAQIAASWAFMAVPVLAPRFGSIAKAFRPAFLVAAGSTLLITALAVPILVAIQNPSAVAIAAFITYSVALSGLQGVYATYQADKQMAKIAVAQSMERLSGLLLVIVLLGLSVISLDTVQSALAVAALATCVIGYVALHGAYGLWSGVRISRREFKSSFSTVLGVVGGMAVTGVCAYFGAWVGTYLIAAFKGNYDVGQFTIAYQVFNFLLQIGSLWAVAMLPRHAVASAAGTSVTQQLPFMRSAFLALSWAAAVVALGIVSGFLIPVVFGSGYSDAVVPVRVLTSGAVFTAAYFLAMPALVADGRARAVGWISVIGLMLTLGIDLILIPPFGIVGAAIGTAAQTLFAAYVMTHIALGRQSRRLILIGVPGAIALVGLAISENAVSTLAACATLVAYSIGAVLAARRTIIDEPAPSSPHGAS